MSDKNFAILACTIKKKRDKWKKIWMKEYLTKREGKGSYSNIFRELQNESGALKYIYKVYVLKFIYDIIKICIYSYICIDESGSN